jgi:hypothetical protein
VNIHTIGGNFTCDGAALVASHIVGGNLRLRSDFPAGSQTSCHVGGNASIALPDKADLALSATVGGNASSPTITYVRGGGFVNLVYGDGSAHLGLTVSGNLTLSGAEPRSRGTQFSWTRDGQAERRCEPGCVTALWQFLMPHLTSLRRAATTGQPVGLRPYG